MKCLSCDSEVASVKAFAEHARIHRADKVFPCPVPECYKIFGAYSTMSKHLRFHHGEPEKSNSFFKCSLVTCDVVETSLKKIMSHTSNHISSGQPVFCPLKCPTRKPFATCNSLRIHKMYAHRGDIRSSGNGGRLEQREEVVEPSEVQNATPDTTTNGNDENMECDDISDDPHPLGVLEQIIGRLFLNLLSKHHVTNTAIQEIVEALGEVARVEESCLTRKGQIREACDVLLLPKLFGTGGIFRTTHMRKKFYCEHFSFVSPVQIDLQKDANHADSFYHYVPILDTLRGLLNDKNVYKAMFGPKLKAVGYLNDYTDGQKFQDSSFFNTETINIFLYQDAAEVVPNQLGTAAGRHKLLMVYMVLGNLPPHLRGLTDNVQLVLLCKNKDLVQFGTHTIFRRLVEDLKVLEEEGIVVHGSGEPETKFGSVFTTMNDNLGAHQLGGLAENFSKNAYCCRTYYTTRLSQESIQKSSKTDT